MPHAFWLKPRFLLFTLNCGTACVTRPQPVPALHPQVSQAVSSQGSPSPYASFVAALLPLSGHRGFFYCQLREDMGGGSVGGCCLGCSVVPGLSQKSCFA